MKPKLVEGCYGCALLARVFEVPFNSVRRYHLVVARDLTQPSEEDLAKLKQFDGGAIFVVMIKGAPEVVLESCSYLQIRHERVPIDKELREECQVN
ncbi:unnamed protein product [Gongylonema pulchrum]|uniref:Uncharacterized protein n=1 Tax=Gongylonema pulchrum TaxID=637853 RepID=A0A183D8U9_9BILA|nr:unnamed protein product [Gongylonema pulchrum]